MAQQEDLIWLQISSTLLSHFNSWTSSRLSTAEKSQARPISPYSKRGPETSGPILKSGIKTSSNLTRITPEKYRLEGDFFTYLEALERANSELSGQLQIATTALAKDQLDTLRFRNDVEATRKERELLKETKLEIKNVKADNQELSNTIKALAIALTKAEKEHLENLTVLGSDLGACRKELEDCLEINMELKKQLEQTGYGTENGPGSVTRNGTGNVTRNGTAETVQVADILLTETKLVYFQDEVTEVDMDSVSSETSESSLERLTKENNALLEVVAEFKARVNEAGEMEAAFRDQCIEIEQLRSYVLGVEEHEGSAHGEKCDCKDTHGECSSGSNSDSDGVSPLTKSNIIRRLPSKDFRLKRTGLQWEWTPWIKRTSMKALTIDIAGVMSEFKDLRDCRQAAFQTARSSGLGVVKGVASYFPFLSNLLFERVPETDDEERKAEL